LLVNPRNRVGDKPLPPDPLCRMNGYCRPANYLCIGQIHLYDNPLLKKPLKLEHVKPWLPGHWGITPGPQSEHPHGLSDKDFDVLFTEFSMIRMIQNYLAAKDTAGVMRTRG
jgi:phosphoketolase